MSEDNRTPEEIERDIEANRAKLGQTIDKLQRRVAPERVAGEIGDQLRVFGSETVDLLSRDAVERARANPAAAALAAAGAAWLIFGDNRGHRAPARYDRNLPVRRSDLHAMPKAYTSGSYEGSSSVSDKAQSMYDSIKEEFNNLRGRITEGTEDLSDEARDRVVKARQAAIDAAEKSSLRARQGAREVKTAVNDHPYVIGGIALAIGAAIAATVVMRSGSDDDEYDDERARREQLFANADSVLTEELERERVVRATSVLGDEAV